MRAEESDSDQRPRSLSWKSWENAKRGTRTSSSAKTTAKAEGHLGYPNLPSERACSSRSGHVQFGYRQQASRLRSRRASSTRRHPWPPDSPSGHGDPEKNSAACAVRADGADESGSCCLVGERSASR